MDGRRKKILFRGNLAEGEGPQAKPPEGRLGLRPRLAPCRRFPYPGKCFLRLRGQNGMAAPPGGKRNAKIHCKKSRTLL